MRVYWREHRTGQRLLWDAFVGAAYPADYILAGVKAATRAVEVSAVGENGPDVGTLARPPINCGATSERVEEI